MARRKHKNSMKNVDWKIVRFLEKKALNIDPATHFNPAKYCKDLELKMQNYKTSRKAKFLFNCHFVFVTKGRCKILFKEAREIIEEHLPIIAKEYGWEVFACECMPEHIHMFVSLDNVTSQANYVHAIRNRLEEMLIHFFPIIPRALKKEIFSRSYFASSIGNISSLTLFGYIRNQWKNYKCYEEKYEKSKEFKTGDRQLSSFFEPLLKGSS